MGVPFDVSLIVLHLRDSEYGISASPSETDGKNRIASAKFPFVRSLFRESFARLINSAPLSFDHHIEYAFIDVFSITPFCANVNVFFDIFSI